MIDIKNIAKRKINDYDDTMQCKECELAMRDFKGRVHCDAIGDYKTRDYECPKKKLTLVYKACLLFNRLRAKGIVGLEFYHDETIAYIGGFGE